MQWQYYEDSAAQQYQLSRLQLQISNQAASPIPQTATATERELAMQRWLRKFNYDIPDLFEQGQEGHIQSSN